MMTYGKRIKSILVHKNGVSFFLCDNQRVLFFKGIILSGFDTGYGRIRNAKRRTGDFLRSALSV